MSSPWRSFQVEKISRLRRHSRILAGSECVARRPPMARLFDPCPTLGARSTTRTLRPASARARAAGAPTLPAPTMMTSKLLVVIMAVSLRSHPGEDPERDLDEKGPLGLVDDLGVGHAFLAEEAVDERSAGLVPARAHARAGQGLDLADVPHALADKPADLARRHALAAANDGVLGGPGHILGQRVGGLRRLEAEAGDPLGVGARRPDLDDDCAVVGLEGPDRGDLDPAERIALGVLGDDRVSGIQALLGELEGDGHGRELGVLTIIDERDGQSRADGHALLAARAALAAPGSEKGRELPDVALVDVDEAGRTDGRAGIAGDLLMAVQHREDARLLGRDPLVDGSAGAGLQDLRRPVPVGRDLADIVTEGPGDLEPPDLAGEDGRRGLGDLLGVPGREGRQPELAGLLEELVDGVEAHGDEERV